MIANKYIIRQEDSRHPETDTYHFYDESQKKHLFHDIVVFQKRFECENVVTPKTIEDVKEIVNGELDYIHFYIKQ